MSGMIIDLDATVNVFSKSRLLQYYNYKMPGWSYFDQPGILSIFVEIFCYKYF